MLLGEVEEEVVVKERALAKVFKALRLKKKEIVEEAAVEPSAIMSTISMIASRPLQGLFLVYILGYILLRLKVLPKKMARLAMKIYLPITYLRLIFLPPFDGLFSWIGEDIMIGVAPFGFLIPHLVRLNVRGAVNIGEFSGAQWPASVEVLTRPVRRSPSQQDICDAVKFIYRQVQNGNRVYIYDKAGSDRAGIIVLAWLAHKYYYELERNGTEKGLLNLFRLYLKPERHSVPLSITKLPALIAFADSLPLFDSNGGDKGGTEESKSSSASKPSYFGLSWSSSKK